MTLSADQKRLYQREWLRNRRLKAVEMLGGCCSSCGSLDDLEVDHIDPEQKPRPYKDRRSINWSQSWVKLEEELELCQLLCATCHRHKTRDQARVSEHGLTMYKVWGCRCDICKAAKKIDNAKRYTGR